ncbi:MAG: NAD-dependent epimerase/dehydratase family protein, partial [Patescibacteria group bacterium]|nr:NAD-dependent epimerase/dehydratase family protein [Patescibacteria group bacterium]
ETRLVNIVGTQNIAVATRAVGARLVFSSSSAVYGDQPFGKPIKEDAPLGPKSPYGEHKLIAESFSDVSLRYFNVFGPRQRSDSPYSGVIARFVDFKRAGKPLIIFGDGLQTRDFVYVDDVARANLVAMEKAKRGSVYNIGSGVSSAILDIANFIGGPIEYKPARIEPHDSLADISKVGLELCWEPKISLQEGIRRILL